MANATSPSEVHLMFPPLSKLLIAEYQVIAVDLSLLSFPPIIEKILKANDYKYDIDHQLLCLFGDKSTVDCHGARKWKRYNFRMTKCDLMKYICCMVCGGYV